MITAGIILYTTLFISSSIYLYTGDRTKPIAICPKVMSYRHYVTIRIFYRSRRRFACIRHFLAARTAVPGIGIHNSFCGIGIAPLIRLRHLDS